MSTSSDPFALQSPCTSWMSEQGMYLSIKDVVWIPDVAKGADAAEGQTVPFATLFSTPERVNSATRVAFPSEPTIGIGENGAPTVTYGGETVKLKKYYKPSVAQGADGWSLSLALDAEQVRPKLEADGDNPIKVGADSVVFRLGNVEPDLYYGVNSASSLGGESTQWQPGALTQGKDLQGGVLSVGRGEGSSGFYILYVTDIPPPAK